MKDRKRDWILVGAGEALLLLLLLLGMALGVCTAYRLAVQSGLLLLGLGLIWGASCVVWLLPRRIGRIGGAIGYLLLWMLFAYWKLEWIWTGCLEVAEKFSITMHRDFTWFPLLDLGTDLSWIDRAYVSALCLLMGLALFALVLGWAVFRLRRGWLIILLSLLPLLPALLAGAMPDALVFILLGTGWFTALLLSRVRTAPAGSRWRLLWLSMPCSALVMSLLLSWFPSAGYTQPGWTADARKNLMALGGEIYRAVEDLPLLLSGDLISFPGGSGNEVNLSDAGPLHYTGKTVLELTGEPGNYLLRGTAYARYTGESWELLPSSLYRDLLVEEILYSGAEESRKTMIVENVAAPSTSAYTPYQTLPSEDLQPQRDVRFRSESGRTYTVMYSPMLLGAAARAEGTDPAYEQFVRENYLDVPEDLVPLLQDLLLQQAKRFQMLNIYWVPDTVFADSGMEGWRDLEIFRQKWADYYSIISLEDFIPQLLYVLADYDPNTPVTPEGEDFVRYFLEESHRGYCMHFASAAVLLFRTAGVPARYVSGYSAQIEAGGTSKVKDSSAHAWVEIYQEGYGWYPVDVTPPYEEEQQDEDALPPGEDPDQEDPDPTEEQEPEPPEEDPEITLPPSQDGGSEAADGNNATGGGIPGWGKGLAAVLLAGIALFLRRRLARMLRQRQMDQANLNRSAIAAYRWMERMVPWGTPMDPTAAALAEKAKFSPHTLTEEERAQVWSAARKAAEETDRRLSWWKRLVYRWLWGLF